MAAPQAAVHCSKTHSSVTATLAWSWHDRPQTQWMAVQLQLHDRWQHNCDDTTGSTMGSGTTGSNTLQYDMWWHSCSSAMGGRMTVMTW